MRLFRTCMSTLCAECSAPTRNIIRVSTAFVRMLRSGDPLLGVNRCLQGFVRAEFGVGTPGCRKGSLGRALKLRDMNHRRRRPCWVGGWGGERGTSLRLRRAEGGRQCLRRDGLTLDSLGDGTASASLSGPWLWLASPLSTDQQAGFVVAILRP